MIIYLQQFAICKQKNRNEDEIINLTIIITVCKQISPRLTLHIDICTYTR